MGRMRFRVTVVAAVLALVAVGCGDDGAVPTPGDVGESPTGDGNDAPADAPADAPGERSAVITIDGVATNFAVDDIVYSQIDGVDDITFETCSPDFFGSGRFYAIGYAVDADGELIVGDDGSPAGTFTMDLPPDDWEAAERDAPEFEIDLDELSIEIATPERLAEMAPGGTMEWTVDDTRASGSAVFTDFDSAYDVQFELICEGSPAFDVDDLPVDPPGDDGNGSEPAGGLPAGGGSGSFTVDGAPFDGATVYSCEPFTFGSQEPHPDDVSVVAVLSGGEGLEVEVSNSQGVDFTNGTQFDQIYLNVFYSHQGASGLEQFEGSAVNDAGGAWYTVDRETGEQAALDAPPFRVEGGRIVGMLAGLDQSWPDEGAATVDVTFDFEIPETILEDC